MQTTFKEQLPNNIKPQILSPLNKDTELKHISNSNLLSRIKLLVQKERNIHIHVLHHLREIQSRKLYLKLGFSSLFDYAVKELGYSEGAAYRRIKAMKLCQEVPETTSRLQSGKLSLSSACQLQTFFEKQEKILKKENTTILGKNSDNKTFHLDKIQFLKDSKFIKDSFTKFSQDASVENQHENKTPKLLNLKQKQDLIKKVEGKSARGTMKLLSEIIPPVFIPNDQVCFLGQGRVEIKTIVDEDCYKNLEELKSLLSHKNPSLSYGELISILSEEVLKRRDLRKKQVRQKLQTKKNHILTKKIPPASENQCVNNIVRQTVVSGQNKQNNKENSTEIITSISKGQSINKVFIETKFPPKKSQRPSRYIPTYLKKYVWERDSGRCTYVHPETRRRCSSTHLLQIDHIKPFALGGKSEKENLRLLCAAHNRFRNDEFFIRTKCSP